MYLLMFTPVSNFKAINQLVMEILHFQDLGYTESVVTNAVVLVIGGCPISMAMYLGGGGYLPSYKVLLFFGKNNTYILLSDWLM